MVLSCGLEVWPPGFRHFTTSHLGFSVCAERRVGAAAGAGAGPTVGAPADIRAMWVWRLGEGSRLSCLQGAGGRCR